MSLVTIRARGPCIHAPVLAQRAGSLSWGQGMPDTLIENPILNSPYREPTRHFRFARRGDHQRDRRDRRSSAYFVPIPPPKKKGKQLEFDTEWTEDRIEPNDQVNRIRERVKHWREGEYQGITQVTRKLLQHWTDPDRENKLFFCQIEALETLIYLTEAAKKVGDNWIENWLRDANDAANPGLNRIAMKMATGSGKTVVMAMLIAWHALNKIADPKDRRFSDTFLVVTPGSRSATGSGCSCPTTPRTITVCATSFRPT